MLGILQLLSAPGRYRLSAERLDALTALREVSGSSRAGYHSH